MSNTKNYVQSCQEYCQCLADYLKTQFTEHPAQASQTWGQHCLEALWFSVQALGAGGALFVHALIPCWFQEWGVDRINTFIKEKRSSLHMRTVSEHPLARSIHEKDT